MQLSDLSTDNLRYLNSEQALEDLANFRNYIHERYGLTDANIWVSFGGSYPGSLSAWLRQKYPHLIHAAVSSSAPMLAKTNFLEYYQVVNESLYKYSPECPEKIQLALEILQYMFRTASGLSNLKSMFK